MTVLNLDDFFQKLHPEVVLWVHPTHLFECQHVFLEADLARQLAAGGRILVDEFTSVLDRALAAALCISVESYVPWKGRGNPVFLWRFFYFLGGEFVAGDVFCLFVLGGFFLGEFDL